MINATAKKPTYEELEARVVFLELELNKMRRMIFGQKRERFVPEINPHQLAMPLYDQPVEPAPPQVETITYTRKSKKTKTHHGRNPLPAHLPRKEILIKPDIDVTHLKKIGEEITEELEYKPGQLFVNRYIRPKYAQPDVEGVIIANLPTRPIEKGIAGPGLLSHVLVSKFVDHLPLYRQRQQFKRQDVELSMSTLTDWVKQTADLLQPLYHELKSNLLQSHYLQADESTLRVLDREKKGRSHLGYMWIYYSPPHGLVFFDYRKGRGRAGPNEMLQNFTGYLQTDAYDGYNDITEKPDVTGVGCFAHARRYFKDALPMDSERATWMLKRFQKLYAIEEQAREDQWDQETRYTQRQTYALPVLKEMKSWLDRQYQQVLPKSAIGKAVSYALGQWPRLQRYTHDGCLEIDNNWIENVIRPLALGRKNYLFAGSHDGARRTAIIYSLVATAKKHNIEPFAYLRDIISRIADHPIKRISLLLPPDWQPKI